MKFLPRPSPLCLLKCVTNGRTRCLDITSVTLLHAMVIVKFRNGSHI